MKIYFRYILNIYIDGSLTLRQRKQRSFAASCVVNRPPQMAAGLSRTNALPAVPPVGFPLLPCDWKCWLCFFFSGFRPVPRRARYLSQPAAEGSGCCFRLLSGIKARRQRKKGGLRKEENIYLALERFTYVRNGRTAKEMSRLKNITQVF